MNILGLDPACNCGYAHSSGQYGVWKLTQPNDKHPGRRLERFRRQLFTAKREWGIDILAAEDAAFGNAINRATQAMHNELRGMIKLCAAEWDIEVLLYTPSALKKWMTGKGNAKKDLMIHAVKFRFGISTQDDNIADAIAVMEFAKHMIARKAG